MIQNTCDMGGYFGPDTQSATGNMKATHTTVRNMTQKFQSSEHKVLWTILFLVHNFKWPKRPEKYVHAWQCNTNERTLSRIWTEKIKMKMGGIQRLTAIVWEDIRSITCSPTWTNHQQKEISVLKIKWAPLGERVDKFWTRLQLWWKAKYMALPGIESRSSNKLRFTACKWTPDIWL